MMMKWLSKNKNSTLKIIVKKKLITETLPNLEQNSKWWISLYNANEDGNKSMKWFYSLIVLGSFVLTWPLLIPIVEMLANARQTRMEISKTFDRTRAKIYCANPRSLVMNQTYWFYSQHSNMNTNFRSRTFYLHRICTREDFQFTRPLMQWMM